MARWPSVTAARSRLTRSLRASCLSGSLRYIRGPRTWLRMGLRTGLRPPYGYIRSHTPAAQTAICASCGATASFLYAQEGLPSVAGPRRPRIDYPVDRSGANRISMTSVMHLCGAAARDGGYAISQRVGVQDQPGDPLDDLFELQLRFGPGFAAGACAAACRRSRRLVACVCAAPPSARPLRPSPGVQRTAHEGSWRHSSGWFPHLGPWATYQGSPVAGHGSALHAGDRSGLGTRQPADPADVGRRHGILHSDAQCKLRLIAQVAIHLSALT